jgi:hypothetical protein
MLLTHTHTHTPPLTPPSAQIVPINLLGFQGYPLRNDNASSFAYVGEGDGQSQPEMYSAFHEGDPADDSPIQPGETT